MNKVFKTPIAIVLTSMLACTSSYANTEARESSPVVQEIDAKININSASVDTLVTLPGIGVKKAQMIIQFREEHGRFLAIEELQEVKGVGEKLFAKVAPLISV